MSELKLVYSRRIIMSNAWRRAREAAWLFGGCARAYLAAALREVWEAARSPAAAAAAMRDRVRHSIATLKDDIAACDAFMRDLYARDAAARQEAQRPAATATVLAFPDRRTAPAVPATRVAA